MGSQHHSHSLGHDEQHPGDTGTAAGKERGHQDHRHDAEILEDQDPHGHPPVG